MQLFGYLLLAALGLIWIAIIDFCLNLISAPSDAKVYTGCVVLLLSIPAMVRLGKSVYNLTKLKEQ